jgi:phage terminase large subunit-like protein
MPAPVPASSRASSKPAPPRKSEAFDTLPHFRRFGVQLLKLPDGRGAFRVDGWQEEVCGSYFGTGPLPPALQAVDLDALILAGHLQPSDAAFARGAARETGALVPTGCGKTTLYAALAIHHGTFVRVDARAVILSSNAEQGKKLFTHAVRFVRASPLLRAWWEVRPFYGSGGQLVSTFDGSVIEVISSNPETIEGDDQSLLLGEELHEHKDDGEAYGILLGKWKKRRARALWASTAGDDEDSFLGRKRALMLDPRQGGRPQRGLRRGEHYVRGEQRDPSGALESVLHEWAVPDGVDVDDLDEVLKATPAAYVTKADLASDWAKTRARPWDWLRRHCNRWARGERSAIDAAAWRDRTADRRLRELDVLAELVDGFDCWHGFDVGGRSDTTAVMPAWRLGDVEARDEDDQPILTDLRDDDGALVLGDDGGPEQVPLLRPQLVHAHGQIVWPPGNGAHTRLDDVLEAIDAVLALPGEHQGFVYDPNAGGAYLIQDVEKHRPELWLVEHGQQAEKDDASELLAQVVFDGWLRHDGDPQVTRQVLTAVVRTSRRGRWYLDKPQTLRRTGPVAEAAAKQKIDAAVGLSMGVRTALFPPPPRNPEPLRARVLNSSRP